jgi:hypothetical protein
MDSTGAVEDLSKLFPFSEEDLSEYDPVDPKESPMWAVVRCPIFYLQRNVDKV